MPSAPSRAPLRAPLDERGLLKICGLRDAASVDAAIGAGADLIGLVFVPESVRAVTPATAARLTDRAGGNAAVVGLFQNAALSDIEAVLDVVPLDLIQLHGRETEDDVRRVKDGFGLPVIKAIGVSGPGDLYAAAGHPADLLLYDAKPPPGAGAAGGHGAAFDWSMLAGATHTRPWLLAGGLHSGNIAEAIGVCRPLPGFAGVDVSSGVEASRGIKDAGAIERFARAARAAMGAAPLSETTHA